jgi:hypothetical protein
MTPIVRGMVWAALIVLLVIANKLGLMADKDAATMLAIIPAIWIATTSPRCRRKGASA